METTVLLTPCSTLRESRSFGRGTRAGCLPHIPRPFHYWLHVVLQNLLFDFLSSSNCKNNWPTTSSTKTERTIPAHTHRKPDTTPLWDVNHPNYFKEEKSFPRKSLRSSISKGCLSWGDVLFTDIPRSAAPALVEMFTEADLLGLIACFGQVC